MFSKLKSRIVEVRKVTAIGFGLAGMAVLFVGKGFLEPVELGILDQFFRLRVSFTRKDARSVDDRLLVVTIDENDIANAGQWPISDGTLSQLLREIGSYDPAGVGVDLYRNFPVEPGSAELDETFYDMPMVVGAERVIGEPVAAHSTLDELGQGASIDLIVDRDGRARRGLLSVMLPDRSVKQGLAASLVLSYLERLDIAPEAIETNGDKISLQLGKTRINRFESNDGGYVRADSGGFQILMSYRDGSRQFESISMTAVMNGELTNELVRDRIVLIGSIAVSLNDLFYTPLDSEAQVAGVYIHAHLASQLLNASLDGQPLLRTSPDYIEWLWVGCWIIVTVLASRPILYSQFLRAELPAWQLGIRVIGSSASLAGVGFALFWAGWWLPVALPFVSMIATVGLGVTHRNQQLQNLAAYDELTQIANRRYFDQYLKQVLKEKKQLSLILCDVDHFKAFNDLYGHPAGDICLYQVAQAIKTGVRGADMVARYGGEEFVVVLPDADQPNAQQIAQRIQAKIQELSIEHKGSSVSESVTLSGGCISVPKGSIVDAHSLVEHADKALYQAKQSGRNQILVSQWPQEQDDFQIDLEEAV